MKLAACKLVQDYSLYPRESVDQEHVSAIEEALRAGIVLPPIVIEVQSRRIVDGFHRTQAYIRLYGEEHEVEVVEKKYRDTRDLFLDAVGLNAAHGRPLGKIDKAKALHLALKLDIDESAIIKTLGITTRMAAFLCVTNGAKVNALPRPSLGPVPVRTGEERCTASITPKLQPADAPWTKKKMVDAVISAVEGGGVDTGDLALMQSVTHLGRLIDKFRVIPATLQNGYTMEHKLGHELLELAWKGIDVAHGNLPYFPFYVRDFVSDGKVEAMTTEQTGAYVLLLCKAWHETPPCSIPNDDAVLARWARMEPLRWSLCRAAVLSCWTLNASENRHYQKRLLAEYRKLREVQKLRSQAGTKGNAKRWQSDRMAITRASDYDSDSESPEGGRGGKPNPLWDALCSAFDIRPVTKSQCSRVGALVKQLAAHNATPDDIPGRISRYRKAWPAMACTPEAVVKHWAEFAPKRKAPQTGGKSMEQLDAERRAATDAEVLAERASSPRAPACKEQEQR